MLNVTRAVPDSSRLSIPAFLIKVESLALLIAALGLYIHLAGSGLLFFALILAPDLSALGYLKSVGFGSALYNSVHTYMLPAMLLALSLAWNNPLILQITLIWFTHIAADRLLGYGLKYPTEFKDTHLGRI
jgi:Domain of unknown function (DUF4260)